MLAVPPRQCCDLISTTPACDERDGGEQKSMMSESSICYSSFVVASRSLVPNVRIHFLRISFILDILLDLLVVLPCGRVRPQGGGSRTGATVRLTEEWLTWRGTYMFGTGNTACLLRLRGTSREQRVETMRKRAGEDAPEITSVDVPAPPQRVASHVAVPQDVY